MGDMEMDMESMMGGGDSKVKSSDGSNVEIEVGLWISVSFLQLW